MVTPTGANFCLVCSEPPTQQLHSFYRRQRIFYSNTTLLLRYCLVLDSWEEREVLDSLHKMSHRLNVDILVEEFLFFLNFFCFET